MGATDFVDAAARLSTLSAKRLRKAQRREVIRVVWYCATRSSQYNAYFAYLAQAVCNFDPASKFTFQLCVWDALKDFSNDSTLRLFETSSKKAKARMEKEANAEPAAPTWTARRLVNAALFLAFLIKRHVVSLAILKAVEWSNLEASPPLVLFLRALFEEILNPAADSPSYDEAHDGVLNLDAVFRRIAAGAARATIHDGISSFFEGTLKAAGYGRKAKASDSDKVKEEMRVRRLRWKRARRCLKEVRAFQHAAAADGAGSGLSNHRALELDEMVRGNGPIDAIDGMLLTVAYRGTLDTFTGIEFDVRPTSLVFFVLYYPRATRSN